MQSLPEILLIDKPTGMTSFDVIRQLRRRTKVRKFGHAGTLDPAASGLMILGVERGTKRLTEFIKLDKEYVAEILLGESRTTGDMDGEVLVSVDEVEVDETTIYKAVRALVGKLTLTVSAYSAIKKDGIPMYKRAYAAAKLGEVMSEVPIRDMTVFGAEVQDISIKSIHGQGRVIIKICFTVASGTYIRSLAVKLGDVLGYPATLYSLRRTKIGTFTLTDAKQLTDF